MQRLDLALIRRAFAATIVLPAALVIAAPIASARKIFINGTEITHTNIRDQRIGDVQFVLFDDDGDLHVVAPGYRIRVNNANTDGPPRDAEAMETIMGTSYFALFVNSERESVPYELTLKVNGVDVRTFAPSQATTAVDISGYMQLGNNDVEISASGAEVDSPVSVPDSRVRLVVGPGSVVNGRATVRSIAASLDVIATETQPTLSQRTTIQVIAEGEEAPGPPPAP